MSGDREANDASRPGGEARGGIDPRPGDPDTPLRARRRHRESGEAHADAGFGDDKGGDAE